MHTYVATCTIAQLPPGVLAIRFIDVGMTTDSSSAPFISSLRSLGGGRSPGFSLDMATRGFTLSTSNKYTCDQNIS